MKRFAASSVMFLSLFCVLGGSFPTVPASAKLAVKATSPSVFEAPTVILAPTIANDSPGQMWYFPTRPALVIRDIHRWLAAATPTTAVLPKANRNLTFHAYMGPSELYFTDEAGSSVLVAPAFDIAHGNRGYYPFFYKDVLTYKDAGGTRYIKSPTLFAWLANDKNWESQFRTEAFTNADKSAITAAKKSRWGGLDKNIFPPISGIDKTKIQYGANAPRRGQGIFRLAVTVETQVDVEGSNRRVTFIEVWNNGANEYRLSYVVSPRDAVLSHVQSGDTPPQDWR